MNHLPKLEALETMRQEHLIYCEKALNFCTPRRRLDVLGEVSKEAKGWEFGSFGSIRRAALWGWGLDSNNSWITFEITNGTRKEVHSRR